MTYIMRKKRLRLLVTSIVLLTIWGFIAGIQSATQGPALQEGYSPKIGQGGGPPAASIPEDATVTDVAEYSSPSVVAISADIRLPFGREEEVNIERKIASGFIISEQGYIVTNKHVVDHPEIQFRVTIDDQDFDIERIYKDPNSDLAILKISSPGKMALPLGNSSAIRLGERVVAIGTTFGMLTNSVTSGIISGLGRNITAGSPLQDDLENLEGLIQTDAAINAGNSGGPLLNLKGEVIGINTAGSSSGQNIGFAIPVNVLKDFISSENIRL